MIRSHLIYEDDRALFNGLITKDNLEGLDIDGKIILQYSFKKCDVSVD
jgi:hypothetical protein